MATSYNRTSLMIPPDQLEELQNCFQTIDSDGNGVINVAELGKALDTCGFKLPGYKVRDLIQDFDNKIKDDQLDFEEFKGLYARLKMEMDFGHAFKKAVSPPGENVRYVAGSDSSSAEGTTHSVRNEEQVAFSNWINRNLDDDPDCKKYLPLNPDSKELYTKTNDGILYCKMVNSSSPGTIDERTINKGSKLSVFQIHENLTLALNSAQSIGCNIINIGPEDLRQGKPHLVLGLLWQIIRIGLFSEINLHENPNLAILLMEGETLEEFMKLSPEHILIRWVNYHLARSGCGRQIANFQGDIKDSIAYIHLLDQISPKEKGVTTRAENEPDMRERAELMLQEAEKIECRSFVSPDDVVSGNYKLNVAYVANLFNNYPALEETEVEFTDEITEETREEKMYRNWMNSMGVRPYVNYMYGDMHDGLIIFQLYDIIKPGVVDWKKVVEKFNKMKMMMEKIGNCNYAVDLGKQSKFSLVGIDGKDIYDGNQTLTLALVWQLMKAYTLSILTKLAGDDTGHPVVEKEIVNWANEKLKTAGKQRQITGFNDQSIADGKVVIDLVDAIKNGSVNYDNVKPGQTEQERLDNAKFAISMARKIGARVYALPDDIVEVKSKMVMTVFACLMIRDFQPDQKRTDH